MFVSLCAGWYRLAARTTGGPASTAAAAVASSSATPQSPGSFLTRQPPVPSDLLAAVSAVTGRYLFLVTAGWFTWPR